MSRYKIEVWDGSVWLPGPSVWSSYNKFAAVETAKIVAANLRVNPWFYDKGRWTGVRVVDTICEEYYGDYGGEHFPFYECWTCKAVNQVTIE